MMASAILVSAMLAQPEPPAAGSFSPAEVRTMCRGETEEPARFRTDAAFRLLAQHQRSNCRMYLLGLADGIGRSLQERESFCLPPVTERDLLADRLAEAVLSGSGEADADIAAIVRQVLLSHYRCR